MIDFVIRGFNTSVDLVNRGFHRLVSEVPLALLIPALAAAFFVVAGLLRLGGRVVARRPWPSRRALGWAGAVWAVLALVLLFDRKFELLAYDIAALRGLRGMVVKQMQRTAGAGSAADAKNVRWLFDHGRARSALEAAYPGVEMHAAPEARAVDYVRLKLECPRVVQLAIAVVNLRDPDLEIVVTPEMTEKWATSDFARRFGCCLAINGEAGESSAEDAPLGQWTGNWIAAGKPVLLEDGELRPFLSFDAANRPRYFPAALVDRTPSPEKHNTIWGRFDILIGGKAVGVDHHDAPRTCMAVDAEGSRLVLLVADGRQPGFSHGVGLDDAARIMSAFGATDGMCCDEGGSSCMYLKSIDDVVNVPSDHVGERPTYSHFGVRMKP